MSCSDNVCSLTNIRPEFNNIRLNDEVYTGISSYYNNPLLTKVESPNPLFSMYCIGVTSFCAERRYLFAICQTDRNPIGMQVNLDRLRWVSFQVRISSTNYPVPSSYFEGLQNSFTQKIVQQIPTDNGVTTYQLEGYPLKIQLLGNGSNYRSRGTVEETLQTFNTVLFFV